MAAVPLISVVDVHQFDIGAIGNFGATQVTSPILEELFHFSNSDLDGPINPPSDSSLDFVESWLTEPPLSPVNPPSPLEFTSENILHMVI
ncbi:hypothetical protein BDM02DRAFT_3193688 [Thelephora ganbajun]|uniref:Uncharacterized protein n=1 Tax=Thelephora ganbajun TaxID=370292 RepID=A0ACB6YZA7_THEGA|nr:hypothetical protein BDM02DRAFT_3193688 [Thelephora ganbajun]